MTDDYKKYLINFDTSAKDFLTTPIYRVFSLEKFLTSLSENTLFLVKTKLWEDPFEAFLLKQLIWKLDGTENYPFENNLVENFFGQCWTLLKESNLLWKVYAPSNDGIIIKSTIGKFIELFLMNQTDSGEHYFGKVIYTAEEELKKYYENDDIVNQLLTDKRGRIILESLFKKRKEFEQEMEVRLIFYNKFASGKALSITKSGYDFTRKHLFNELAEEIILDPRTDPFRNESIIKLIVKLGYTGKIKTSTLFDFPQLILRKK